MLKGLEGRELINTQISYPLEEPWDHLWFINLWAHQQFPGHQNSLWNQILAQNFYFYRTICSGASPAILFAEEAVCCKPDIQISNQYSDHHCTKLCQATSARSTTSSQIHTGIVWNRRRTVKSVKSADSLYGIETVSSDVSPLKLDCFVRKANLHPVWIEYVTNRWLIVYRASTL